MVHAGVIRQAAKVVSMDQETLSQSNIGMMRFRFMYRPEFVKEGTTILFREGRTKGLGVITRTFKPKSVGGATAHSKKGAATHGHGPKKTENNNNNN